MARSSVIASGRTRSHRASASSPLAALPTTSTPASLSELVTIARIIALSSATTTRAGAVVLIGRGRSAAGAAQAAAYSVAAKIMLGLSRTMRRSPTLAMHSISVGVGAGDFLDLIVGDGEDLLDAVDDHAGGLRAQLDDDDLGVLGDL